MPAMIRAPVTNSTSFRVVGFTKLLFINLPSMNLKTGINVYIQECWLYLIWLSLLAGLLSVSRTNVLNTTNYLHDCGLMLAIHVYM